MERKTPDKSIADKGKRSAAKLKQNKFFKFFEERIDWKDERKVALSVKAVILVLTVLVELWLYMRFLFWMDIDYQSPGFGEYLFLLFVSGAVLTAGGIVRLFFAKATSVKTVCILLEMIASVVMIAITGYTYLVFLYLLILTGFYIGSHKAINTMMVFIFAVVVYLLSYGMAMAWWGGGVEVPYGVVISESVWSLVALVAHFFFVNFAVGFYQQYLKLDRTMSELTDNKAQLQKAYDSLAEATALEERQRIAKEIHDTAGHSLTTVIMQTESAKLLMDKNPEEAKRKIVAANLQARHALEELRESVHVLSGNTARGTLKYELVKVIEESTQDTGLVIRYEIEELTLSAAKDRFLCNALKECISNAIRHGGATAFWVELKRIDGRVRLLVSDNGKGVAMSELKKGYGLQSMAEYAERLGGETCISSEPDDGFEVTLFVPLDDEI